MRPTLIVVILFISSQVFAHQYLNNGYEAKDHQFGIIPSLFLNLNPNF